MQCSISSRSFYHAGTTPIRITVVQSLVLALTLLLVSEARSESDANAFLSADPQWQFAEPLSVVRPVPGAEHQSIAVTESGRFWLMHHTSGRAVSLLNLDLDTAGDLGVSDLLFHPDFPADNRVFIAWSGQGRAAAIVTQVDVWRWAYSGATAPRLNEAERLFTVPASGIWRTQARLAFDASGRLLVALGDGGMVPSEINKADNWRGKLLRFSINQSAPGQPFVSAGAAGVGSPVMASGLRSPAGLVSGGPLGTWVLDLGPEGAARLFAAADGVHFGWPCQAGERQLRGSGACASIAPASPQWDSGPREPMLAPGNLVIHELTAWRDTGLPSHTLLFADAGARELVGYSPFGPRELRIEVEPDEVRLVQVIGGQLTAFSADENTLFSLRSGAQAHTD